MDDATALLDLFKRRRHELRWSQRDVADRLGTTQATVARWEAGTVDPQVAMAARWAAVLGLELTAVWSAPVDARPAA